jgi:hypothetical protein
MPQVFTAGKNIFKFKPDKNVVSSKFPISIEVLDKNGNPIYHESLKQVDDSGLINVSVYIYNTVPSGPCSVTILATVVKDRLGNPLSDKNIRLHNYKYIHRLSLDTSKLNDSEIIYDNSPKITIKEKKFSIIEENHPTGKLTTVNGYANYSVKTDGTPTLVSRDNAFTSDFVDGIVKFSHLSSGFKPTIETGSFVYSGSIKEVVSPLQINLADAVFATSSNGIITRIDSVENQPYSIEYYKKPTERTITENIKSYAKIDISGLDPLVGNTSRVKVFSKSSNKPNQSFELVYDGNIEINNILADSSSKILQNPLGTFSNDVTVKTIGSSISSSLNPFDYWIATGSNGAPQVTLVTSSFGDNETFTAISVSSSGTPATITGTQEFFIEQTSSIQIPFYKDAVYSLSFDYVSSPSITDTRTPKFRVFASGSSFTANSRYGKFIGNVPVGKKYDNKVVKNFKMKIPVNRSGTGIIKFLVNDGIKLSNIKIGEDIDFGFSPNRTTLYVPIKQDHRNEYLDFKVQYFNDTLRESNVSSSFYPTYMERMLK